MIPRVIALDFDGTIIESVGIKDEAFRVLFAAYPKCFDQIIQYHLQHNATIRFEKFEYIFTKILNLPYTDEIKDELNERFSQLVFDEIVSCPYVNGALEFLEHFKNNTPLYLISMSPEEELLKILQARELTSYFKKIYASGWKKKDAIADILKRENIAADEAVYVGDTEEDYQAAKIMNVSFIARDSGKSFSDPDVRIFKELYSLKRFFIEEAARYRSVHDFEKSV